LYIDIHSHVIPGIDDGARNEAIALEMLAIAKKSGTGHIIATPHYVYGNTRYGFATIIEKCNSLNRLAASAGIDITVYPGCEVFITPELIELYEQGLIGTLADSCYMLVEFPMMSIPPYTDNVLYKLQLKGVIPIIAHPERYTEIQRQPDILESFIDRGILAQVNSGSITGIYGRESKKTAMRLIKEGLVQFAASDAHSASGRNPDMSKAAALVEKHFGTKTRNELFTFNPLKIINIEI
jgi:protein-tyrosine phosphatase